LRRRGEVVLWPVYFDSTRSRSDGRRVPKRLAVPSPSLRRLQQALDRLGFKYRVVKDAAHPRLPWRRTGMVFVEKAGSKSEILMLVARELSRPDSARRARSTRNV